MFSFNIRNPKISNTSNKGKSSWYDYYAGFSPGFVTDVINHIKLPLGSKLLDPWNGSGTTTQIAKEMGYMAIGYDINPVMLIVAKARQLDIGVRSSLIPIKKDIIHKAKRNKTSVDVSSDPLKAWFDISTIIIIRKIENEIKKLLVNNISTASNINGTNYLTNISDLAAFFYLVLFKTVRVLTRPFFSSNPTWIKVAKNESEIVKWESNDIYGAFIGVFEEMVNSFYTYHSGSKLATVLGIASSDNLPIKDGSIDAIVTSPPYCTRIDYAIYTRPELAVLGFSEQYVGELRNKMIGTPKVFKKTPDINEDWGPTCLNFIDAVAKHDSKAAKTYYYKHFLQYFSGIYQSLSELDRVTKSGGISILVIQDSYFKDVHNDLPKIFIEMGYNLGWKLQHKVDFVSRQSMANVNQKTKMYRTRVISTETVAVFEK